MKIALLGKGKTGSKVLDVAASKGYEVVVFDSKNNPTISNLSGFDCIISFLSGDVFLSYLEILIHSGIPVVSGSTGFDWTPELLKKLSNLDVPWIHSNNFSLGMNIVKKMIQTLSLADSLFEDANFSIHEIHHTKKLDSPSGTAKAWAQWLDKDKPIEISAERTGDVIGFHQLTFTNNVEKITLIHEALDRKIFATGAVWSCEQIKNLEPGLHDFSSIVNKILTSHI